MSALKSCIIPLLQKNFFLISWTRKSEKTRFFFRAKIWVEFECKYSEVGNRLLLAILWAQWWRGGFMDSAVLTIPCSCSVQPNIKIWRIFNSLRPGFLFLLVYPTAAPLVAARTALPPSRLPKAETMSFSFVISSYDPTKFRPPANNSTASNDRDIHYIVVSGNINRY